MCTLGVNGITYHLDNAQQLSATVTHYFGSTRNVGYALAIWWYFTVVAHVVEASYAVYRALATLKLKKSALSWSVMVFFCGFPVMNRLAEFLQVHSKQMVKKNK
uniref:Uncharacterized protein n=1 Tax=Grammatophora oceanica TaxID=210454 RepID=A0A7S1VG41_9STRA|mmetsp:Transcript_45624/g.67821  ORF Transcript_45624/g.67821 Transcript_45624/m.67821 type:complete len:104 (+) Transcript_45624:236-547(+)